MGGGIYVLEVVVAKKCVDLVLHVGKEVCVGCFVLAAWFIILGIDICSVFNNALQSIRSSSSDHFWPLPALAAAVVAEAADAETDVAVAVDEVRSSIRSIYYVWLLFTAAAWDRGVGVMEWMLQVDDMMVGSEERMGGKIRWYYFYQNRERKEYIDSSRCVRKARIDEKVKGKGKFLTSLFWAKR